MKAKSRVKEACSAWPRTLWETWCNFHIVLSLGPSPVHEAYIHPLGLLEEGKKSLADDSGLPLSIIIYEFLFQEERHMGMGSSIWSAFWVASNSTGLRVLAMSGSFYPKPCSCLFWRQNESGESNVHIHTYTHEHICIYTHVHIYVHIHIYQIWCCVEF